MFIYNSYHTVMFSSIESFSVQSNYKGGQYGNIFVVTKTGKRLMFNYDEKKYISPEDAKYEVANEIREAIIKNNHITFS